MSEAVQIIATIAAIAFPNPWTIGFAFATNYAVASYQARQAKKAARAAFEASLRDRQEVIRSSVAPKPIIYGECVAGGVLTYVASTGEKKEFCHLVIAIASHALESIDDIYFNDESIGALDINGDVQSGSKYYKVKTGESGYDYFTISGQSYTLSATPSSGSVNATVSSSEGDITLTVGSVVGNVVTISTDLTAWAGSQINFNYQKQTGEPLVHVVKYPNGSSVADAELVAATGGEWTTSHKGQGIAYIYIRLKYDQDIYQNGIPAMKFKVKGKKIYDPRTGTTAYSNNAALCVYDYLTSTEGFNCASSEINQSSIIAAANICDENVNITASLTQKRYTINGIISSDEKRIDNLENMVLSMVGSAVWTQGKWNIYAGAYNAPSISLSDDDLTNSDAITIQNRVNRRDLFNYIKGVYVEPEKSWQATDFPAIGSATYEGYDGDEEIVRDVQFQFVTDNYRAQRLATVILQQSRLALTVQATFNLKAYHISPSDTISLTIARYGWTNKVFRVVERTFSPNQGVKLILREESSAAYSWSYGSLIPITSGSNSGLLPDQRAILPPTSVTATSNNNTVKQLPDGTQIPRILVQWTPPQDDRVLNGGRIEIEYKASSDTAWTAYPSVRGDTSLIYIEPVEANTIYYVRLRSVSSANTFSNWVYAGGGVEGQEDTTPPSPPTSLVATAAKQAIVLTWTNPTDLDLNTVEIWVNTSATLIGINKVTEVSGERFTHDNLGSNVTRYYYLRAKDHSGNVSSWTSVVSATTEKNLADQIADDIVTTAAFAQGITPVEVADSLPTTGNFAGRTVFLTTNDKIYRYGAANPISVVGRTTQSFGSSTSGSITLPSGLQEGDLVIVAVGSDGSLPNQPSGWVNLNNTANGTEYARTVYKVMGATPDTSVSISGLSTASAAIAIGIRGFDSTTLFDATATVATGSTGMPNAPSITTVNNNSLVIALGFLDDDNVQSSVTAPSGYSNLSVIQSSTAGQTVMLATKSVSSFGVEDPAQFGGTGDDEWVALTIAIRPSLGWTTATDGADILASSITAGKIAVGAIGADQIAANAISADKIAADAVTADKILVSDLSAISANLGTLTAGTINTGEGSTLSMGTDGNGSVFRLVKTDYSLLPPSYLIDYSLRGAPTTMWINSYGYPEGLSSGFLDVDYVTTANFGLSGLSVPVDGNSSTGAAVNVTIPDGSIVLVKHQNTKANNGVYVASSGSWSRLTGYTTNSEMLYRTYFCRNSSLYDLNCAYYLVPSATQNTFAKYNNLTSRSAVDAATTANITLSGTQTIDGYSLSVGQRVLVKDQTTKTQNGIYVVASGAWTRASGSTTAAGLYSSEYRVKNGSVNANLYFVCISGFGTIGTIDIEFIQNLGVGGNWIGESLFLTPTGAAAINIQDLYTITNNRLFSINGARKESQMSVTGLGNGYSAHAARFLHNTSVITGEGTVNASGICATEGGNAFYAETGGYAPFTGTHDVLLSKLDNVDVGDIVVDDELIVKKDLSNTLFTVKKSSIPNKNSIGVLCFVEDLRESDPPAALIDSYQTVKSIDDLGREQLTTKIIANPITKDLSENYLLANVNAIGEGQINVCGENGNIQAGDLIVTSSMAGKGMKQSDDLVRSYTVAKARESATFSTSSEVKQIACIYLCG